MQPRRELSQTTWWMLVILGAAALIYDITWYGEVLARIH